MTNSLGDIAVFVAVVESGSFAAAAEQVNLTRSAVAKTIARLEAGLDVRLFHRTTRSQNLTLDGQTYYESCVRALDALRQARATLESGRQEVAGRLRVSVPVLFGRRCVAPILSALMAQHPKLDLDISFSDRPVALIEEGFDLAIRNGGISHGEGLMTRTISLQRMTVCAAPNHIARHGSPQTIADLQQHPSILYKRDGRVRKWRFPGEGRALHEVLVRGRLSFDDMEAVADACEAGHGLAWLPCWLIRDRVHAGSLVPLLGHLPQDIVQTNALWPETPHLPLRVRMAIDALAAALPGSAEL